MAEGKAQEAFKVCVQCGIQYKESENADGICRFHIQPREWIWGSKYSCCNQTKSSPGCQTKRHRDKHHNDYLYSSFQLLVSKIMNYVNTHKEWCKIEDNDLETDTSYSAQMGLVTQKGPFYNKLYVIVNKRANFFTYGVEDIKNLQSGTTGNTILIKEVKDKDTNAVVKAEFRVDNGCINGVILTIETRSSGNKEQTVVKFEIDGDAFRFVANEQLSKGGFNEYKPSKEYTELCKYNAINIGGEIEQNIPEDIEPKYSGNLNVKIKQLDMKCNNGFNYNGDKFSFDLSVINLSEDKLVFDEIEGYFQLYGDTNFTKLNDKTKGSTLMGTSFNESNPYKPDTLPLTVKGGKGEKIALNIEVFIPFETDGLPKPNSSWYNRSYFGKLRNIKFIFKIIELDGRSVTFETYWNLIKDTPPKANDKCKLRLLALNPLSFSWLYFGIEYDETSFDKIKLFGSGWYREWKVTQIKSLAYNGIKNNTNIIDLGLNSDKKDIKFKAFGFLDTICKRIYCIKLIMETDSVKKTGYCYLPLYGNTDEPKAPNVISVDDEQKFFGNESDFKMDQKILDLYSMDNGKLTEKTKTREIEISKILVKTDETPESTDANIVPTSNADILSLKTELSKANAEIKRLKGILNMYGINYQNMSQWSKDNVFNFIVGIGDGYKDIATKIRSFGVNGKDLITLDEDALIELVGKNKFLNKKLLSEIKNYISTQPDDDDELNCGFYVIPDTKEKLYDYLCAAMALELSTLPIYITAYYSFKDECSTTAKAAKGLLFEILLEEMFHMNIVSNIIASIYSIDYVTTKFNIKYGKGCKLPAQVRSDLNDVSLKPFSRDILYNVFIQIEAPTTLSKESSKVTEINGKVRYPFEPETGKDSVTLSFVKHDAYNEIGEFYNAIKKGLKRLSNRGDISFKFDDNKHMQRICVKNENNDNKHTIRSVNDAIHAIDIICDQGEGYSLKSGIFSAVKKNRDNDDDIKNDITDENISDKSHFVKFIELLVGRKMISMELVSETNNILKYKFTYEKENNNSYFVDYKTDIYSIDNFKNIANDEMFNNDYKNMLELLTDGLKKGDIKDSIGAMRKLKESFKNCMNKGVYPDFKINGYPNPPNVDVYQQ